jgi:hypothetical protein
MKFVKKGQGTPRPATGHVGEWGMMVVEPGKDSQKLGMLVSHFLPDGAFPGKVQVKGKKPGEDWVIEAGDLVYIGPGDSREIKVLGTDPASIYVIMVRG